MPEHILFRADGNNTIGLGHLYRVVALVKMLRSNFSCSLAIKNPDHKLNNLFQEFEEVKPIAENTNPDTEIDIQLKEGDIVVLDGYHFNEAYQKKIKDAGCKLVCIDDLADRYMYADLVINHCSELIRDKYKTETYTRVFTGFRYAILREEFLAAAKLSAPARKNDGVVFICLGGADPSDLTSRIAKICFEIPSVKQIHIVIGAAYQFKEELKTLSKNTSLPAMVIHEHIHAQDMINLIRQSNLAITSASTIAMEVCAVGCNLITGITAENQQYLYRKLTRFNMASGAGEFHNIMDERLKDQIEQILLSPEQVDHIDNQKQHLDGLSGERLNEIFKTLTSC